MRCVALLLSGLRHRGRWDGAASNGAVVTGGIGETEVAIPTHFIGRTLMTHSTRPFHLATIVLAAGFTAGPAAAAAINGAIFTTTVDGQVVNGNNYDAKEDVYLNGGPTKAPCSAGKIETGNYYFQVTSPSGDTLLSSDAITDRGFSTANGVIFGYTGPHGHSVGPCGSDTVQLIPYDDTPNPGGVYKVWVTRQTDYNPSSTTGSFGFVPGNTKTDNFRIKPHVVSEYGTINVYKFYDKNANGMWDGDEIPLPNWFMTLSPPGSGKLTDVDGLARYENLTPDTYSALEGLGGGTWVQSGSVVDGVPTQTLQNPITGLVLTAGETINVEFGNYCTCGSGGKTLAFWTGATGQTKLNDGVGMASEFKLLNGPALRRDNGLQFNLDLLQTEADNYVALHDWLLGAGASTNVAYKLSVQLALMKLNVEAGYVNKNNFYKPYGGTIADLILQASTLLTNAQCGATCNPAGGTQLNTDQQTLTTLLEQLNGNAKVVKAKPCTYRFST